MITAERLRELLHYDLNTGVFTWRVWRGGQARVGAIAGSGKGHCEICADGRNYQAHRLAWLYMTGTWPVDQIDHKNTDKNDNRWSNLRLADGTKNRINTRIQINNTSGFKGVYWYKSNRKWAARIGVSGKSIFLGLFDKPHLAYIAYCIAARKHFGDYARVYEADQLIIPKKKFEERVLRNLLIATQCQFEKAA